MSKSQFFYCRKEKLPLQIEGEESKFKEYEDSFNPELVIRTVLLEDGQRLVLLSDIQERMEKVPQYDSKKTKITGWTKERNTFQSELYLSKEDGERFKKLTNLE